jgi:hypothetical protein
MSWLDDIFSGIVDAFGGGGGGSSGIDFANSNVLDTVVDNSGDAFGGVSSVFDGAGNLSALDNAAPLAMSLGSLGSNAISGAVSGGLESTPSIWADPSTWQNAQVMPTQIMAPQSQSMPSMSGISTGENPGGVSSIGGKIDNAATPSSTFDISGGNGSSIIQPSAVASGSLGDKALKTASDSVSDVWNWVKEHKLPTAIGVLMLASMFNNSKQQQNGPATVAAPSMGGNTSPMKFNYTPKYTPLSAAQTGRYGLSSNASQAPAQWSGTVPIAAARGGSIPAGGLGHGGRGSRHVNGPGTGQSDDIPAQLSDGEYVIDADTVSALGDGSNNAGAKVLDKMRENVRKHKRSASPKKIPPKAKTPEAYMKRA